MISNPKGAEKPMISVEKQKGMKKRMRLLRILIKLSLLPIILLIMKPVLVSVALSLSGV